MIAYVKGTLEHAAEGSAVVECGGVGYLVQISAGTLSRLPSLGSEVKVYTYMQVRDDGQFLHGFLSREEVSMFSLLLSVSGVGAKSALNMLSLLNPSQIMISVVADDHATLSKAQGVGKKTAQRIILELRDKMKASGVSDAEETASVGFAQSSERRDATDALLALGYSRGESLQTVLEVSDDDMSTEAIIRLALKKLAR